MSEAEPKWLQLSDARQAEWDRQCRMIDLIGDVKEGLLKFFDKRAGEDWFVRARDGTEGVRLNGLFSLDELNAHIVAELTGIKLDDLLGENFEAEF